jgi:hypothetical protein
MSDKQGKLIEWSPELWIRDVSTQDYLQKYSKTKMSFKDIVQLGTIKQEN